MSDGGADHRILILHNISSRIYIYGGLVSLILIWLVGQVGLTELIAAMEPLLLPLLPVKACLVCTTGISSPLSTEPLYRKLVRNGVPSLYPADVRCIDIQMGQYHICTAGSSHDADTICTSEPDL